MGDLMVFTEEERRDRALAASRRHYARNREAMRYRDKAPERRKASREWAKKNPKMVRNNSLRSCYGITLDDYTRMHEDQDGRCTICHKTSEQEGRALAVDHCHVTKKVRSLLCTSCNTTIGKEENNPGIFRRMLSYIEEHKQ